MYADLKSLAVFLYHFEDAFRVKLRGDHKSGKFSGKHLFDAKRRKGTGCFDAEPEAQGLPSFHASEKSAETAVVLVTSVHQKEMPTLHVVTKQAARGPREQHSTCLHKWHTQELGLHSGEIRQNHTPLGAH